MSAALYIEKEKERRKGRKTKRAKEENNTIDSASTEQQEEDDRPNDAANLTGYGLLRSSSSGDGQRMRAQRGDMVSESGRDDDCIDGDLQRRKWSLTCKHFERVNKNT